MGYTTDFRGQFGLTEMVYKLLDAIYVEYPEGVSTMPDRLSEAVINILLQLDNVSGGSRKDSTN